MTLTDEQILEIYPYELADRMLPKINFEGTQMPHMQTRCWEWTGYPKSKYGIIKFQRQRLSVHRVAYEIENGLVPTGLNVLHHCDNKRCCNPSHLYVGTDVDNMRDCVERGLHRCPRGDDHPMKRPEVKVQFLGERNPNAKLTPKQVLEIYNSPLLRSNLAKLYNVEWETIDAIKTGLHWSHLTGHVKG